MILLVLVFSGPPAEAESVYLDGEFWTDEDRIIHEGDPGVETRLLMEGRYVFSGMLYGYDFRYVPSDRTREVEQEFTLLPVARIPWGDPALRVVSTRRRRDGAFAARLRYDLAEFQQVRYQAWRRSTVETSSGRGEGELLDGFDGKIAAVEEAVREAVRSHMRDETFNKPRIITGRALLEEPPRVYVVSGCYVAEVNLMLLIDEVVHYTTY
ncbi:MAG: hypothetical protein ACOC28_02035 [Alkalispirochaetaceae bacterium]